MHGNNLPGWRSYKNVGLRPTDQEFQNSLKEERFTSMPAIAIKLSACPPSLRGQGSSDPTVAIHENGQVVVNKAGCEKAGLTDKKFFYVSLDGRVLSLRGLATVPAKMSADDLIPLKVNEKTSGAYFAGSRIMRHDAVNYLYKESGNQVFQAVVDEKTNTVSITLPAPGVALTPPVVHRRPRAKKAKAATATTTATADIDSLD